MDHKIIYNIKNYFKVSEFISILIYLCQFFSKLQELLYGNILILIIVFIVLNIVIRISIRIVNILFFCFFNKPTNFILFEHLCDHIIFFKYLNITYIRNYVSGYILTFKSITSKYLIRIILKYAFILDTFIGM